MRDILLVIEETCTSHTSFDYMSNKNHERFTPYSEDEIFYHFRQAGLSGLLFKAEFDMAHNFYAIDLSPSGHNFLSNIRSDNNWNKTKSIAKNVGSFSMDALKEISASVISNLINSQFTS